MTEYTAVNGDTYATLAKKFFNSEDAAKSLAAFNGVSDPAQSPAEGAVVKIPPRLYDVKSREKSGESTVVTLSLFLGSTKPDSAVVFYAPSEGKYVVLDGEKSDDLSPYLDEIGKTKDMANKIISAWRDTAPQELLSTMERMGKDVESFFGGLSSAPKDAIMELVVVKKHPSWTEETKRFFIRPSVLKQQAGKLAGDWKDAADAQLKSRLSALNKLPDEYGLVKEVVSALCTGGPADGSWPWKWKYADASAALSATAQQFSSSVSAQFVRFIAGCGVSDKLAELEKKLELGKSGSIGFSLVNGTMNGFWYLPQEKGVNLLDILGMSATSKGKKLECFLRCGITAKGYAVSEASLSEFVKLPNLTLGSNGTPGASAGLPGGINPPNANPLASGSGSATASAGGLLLGEIAWTPDAQKAFVALAKADLNASVGAAPKAGIRFSDGNLQCSIPAKDIKGFNGNGALSVDISSAEGMKFVEHVFGCIVYHYASKFSDTMDPIATLASSKFTQVFDAVNGVVTTATQTASAISKWFNEGVMEGGSASGTWYVPQKQGYDLVGSLYKVDLLKPLIKPNRHAFIRFRMEMSGYAYGSASGSSASALAGQVASAVKGSAAASGGVGAYIEWRPTETEEFRVLASVGSMGAMGSVMPPISLPVPCALQYKDGTLKGMLSLKLIPGISLKSDTSLFFTASGAEAQDFVEHVFSSLEVSLTDFLSPQDAEALKNIGVLGGSAAKAIDPNAEKKATGAAQDVFKKL